MRVLLDECLNWRLARELPGHFVSSVQRMGWAGIKNGQLLALAENQFDVFITGDRNLSFQQNLRLTRLSVIVLAGVSTKLKDTVPLMGRVLILLPTLQAGTLHSIPP
jgi:predicted nuclease of predicted toxin-antitoxin system